MITNNILRTDSYKFGHSEFYPKDMTNLFSYLESRGGKFKKTVFFGLQYYLEKYLSQPIRMKDIDHAEEFAKIHFMGVDYFNREKWEYIVNEHNGMLPLAIYSLPEGSLVPVSTPLITLHATDPKCGWLVNYMETLLCKLWYPITVATQSYYIRQCINHWLKKNGTPEDIEFKCHDFGYRGVSCEEEAEIGAASHLLSFSGTDTVAGIFHLQEYYNATEMPGFSIPATEHSIMCSHRKEIDACRQVLTAYPEGLVACVSDTWDIFNCCEHIWGDILYEQVSERAGCLVVRPDSGNFLKIVPEVLEILGSKFGTEVNNKGYQVLNPSVRVIQGDGMTYDTIEELYMTLDHYGWSADNLAVGSGGGLLRMVNRDTCKMAFKGCAVKRGNSWYGISKNPVTDPGKRSKAGLLDVITGYETIVRNSLTPSQNSLMELKFHNGVIMQVEKYEKIVERLHVNN